MMDETRRRRTDRRGEADRRQTKCAMNERRLLTLRSSCRVFRRDLAPDHTELRVCRKLLYLQRLVSAKLHYTDTGYGHVVQHHQRTRSQQFYNKFATSQCQSPTSRHVKMLGCGNFLSVGGVVQHVCSRCLCSGVWHSCGRSLNPVEDSGTCVTCLRHTLYCGDSLECNCRPQNLSAILNKSF